MYWRWIRYNLLDVPQYTTSETYGKAQNERMKKEWKENVEYHERGKPGKWLRERLNESIGHQTPKRKKGSTSKKIRACEGCDRSSRDFRKKEVNFSRWM